MWLLIVFALLMSIVCLVIIPTIEAIILMTPVKKEPQKVTYSGYWVDPKTGKPL